MKKPRFAAGQVVGAIAVGVGLLAGVYGPSFAVVSGLRLPLLQMVPLVMLCSLVLAGAGCWWAKHWLGCTRADFGLQRPQGVVLTWAEILLTVGLSAGAWIALLRFPEPGPLGPLQLTFTQALILFVLLASVQEEFIFRALLQTVLRHRLRRAVEDAASHWLAIALSAVLFAALHLAVGPVTALFAGALGALAGRARARSGSLLSAILCHALFNLPGALALLPGR